MTPERFNECMRALQFSPGGLARLTGRDSDRAVRRWVKGDRPVPLDLAEWLEDVMRYFAEHPPPRVQALVLHGAEEID